MKTAIITILLASFIFPISLKAEQEERLEIVKTDSTDMHQTRTDKGILIELVKNVHLRQGKAEMFCDRVSWWKDRGEVVIENNVRIYDDEKILFADYVFYYVEKRIYHARGNVVLKDTVRQINADQIRYHKLEDLQIADGNVVMDDSQNLVKIFSGRAEVFNEREYALITDDPVFIKYDSTGNEELRITGIKMELFDGGDRAVVTDSVHIYHKDASASCEIAEFYRKQNEVILRQNPFVKQQHDWLRGNLIHLFFDDDNELTKVNVKQNAMVQSKVDTLGNDPRMNKLSGEIITMFFENRQLRQVDVEQKATSYYHVVEDDEYKGLNRIIGDKIIVQIKDRKIVHIQIVSRPQLSEGIFYPSGMEPVEQGNRINGKSTQREKFSQDIQ
ncbi:MAG TPA: hypothetical protein ENN22_16250 [bacterium]|nr:hypothetical protein [bacterium]